jgi:hypothetical protein
MSLRTISATLNPARGRVGQVGTRRWSPGRDPALVARVATNCSWIAAAWALKS